MLRDRTLVGLEALDRPHHRFERRHEPIAEREKLIVRSGLEVTIAGNPLVQEPVSEPVTLSHQLIEIVGRLGLQVRRYRLPDGLRRHAQEGSLQTHDLLLRALGVEVARWAGWVLALRSPPDERERLLPELDDRHDLPISD